jgi:hypothetical protein
MCMGRRHQCLWIGRENISTPWDTAMTEERSTRPQQYLCVQTVALGPKETAGRLTDVAGAIATLDEGVDHTPQV